MKSFVSKSRQRELIGKAQQLFTSDDLTELLKNYRNDKTYPQNANDHYMITGLATWLANDVELNGGTKDEVERALKYMVVCINANIHHLDCMKYADDNGIWALIAKYQSEWCLRRTRQLMH